ncbi:MAG: SpoIIIAH-like family protein [Bacilli bacterium]|nr:SpoIIIAH-like family protein [Bacilli bacterium]
MITKQGLWLLTLFSLILVLSVYYITMPNELLLTNNQNYTKVDGTKDNKDNNSVVNIQESDYLTSLRVASFDERLELLENLKSIITDMQANIEEKNNAYEQIKYLDVVKGQEEKLEAKVKELVKKDAFVKIDNDQIRVVIASNKHDYKLANDIMRSIQEEFNSKMYISVKFQV